MEKLSYITSFKGSDLRFPIYEVNYADILPNLNQNFDFYINDSSDELLSVKNKTIFYKNFNEEKIHYYKNKLSLIESWIFLLEKIKTPYVFTIFDDQNLHNIQKENLENYLSFIESEDMDVCLFVFYETTHFDVDEKILSITNSEMDRINQFKIKEVSINNQKFAIINNDRAQFKYSFFMNNAIYKKDFLLNQLKFYSKIYQGSTSAHQAELNHHLCPMEFRNNKVGIALDNDICHIDLDFHHIVGVRDINPNNCLNFEAIKNKFNIKIL